MLDFLLPVVSLMLQDASAKMVGLESWLPTSLGGWLAVLTAGGLLIDRIKNRGKKDAVDETTLNGLGDRVTKTEHKFDRLDGQFTEHQRAVDRVLVQNENLLREIGKSERSVQQCHDDTEKFSIELGTKVDTMRRDVLAEVRQTRDELTEKIGTLEVGLESVKTEVRLRAEFDSRDDRQNKRHERGA